jgi:hypothetical protein
MTARPIPGEDYFERESVKLSFEPQAAEPAEVLRGPWADRTPAPKLSMRGLDTYNVRAVEWLDKPFLQRSAFHLLAGKKGSCKGTFLCGLASRVTRDKLYDAPKRVLVITSEDSIELDFLPRLQAADGDPALVKIVNGPFRMPADLEWLKAQALELGNVGLIVIDPIGNHLGGADTDKEGAVRDAIKALNPIADELDCMVFGVRHLGKDTGRGSLASVLGSTAWVDVPRCVIVMAADDEDELLFHAQVVAGNRGPRSNGRAFRLELVDVPPAKEITLAVPLGESAKNVEELLALRQPKGAKRDDARKLILRELETGPKSLDELKALAASELGVSGETVWRAANALKHEGIAKPQNSGPGTAWLWRLLTSSTDPGEPA